METASVSPLCHIISFTETGQAPAARKSTGYGQYLEHDLVAPRTAKASLSPNPCIETANVVAEGLAGSLAADLALAAFPLRRVPGAFHDGRAGSYTSRNGTSPRGSGEQLRLGRARRFHCGTPLGS